jgi:hypothetical protein
VLSAGLRRLALLFHVLVSVGFPGAVAAFFSLAMLAMVDGDGALSLAIYRCLEPLTVDVILPLCGLSLASGLVSSLGTPWGLLRHWWVLVKLLLTLPSTAILVMHLMPIAAMARANSLGVATRETQLQLVLASGLALLVLVLLTALSIYKPRGLTGLGTASAAR